MVYQVAKYVVLVLTQITIINWILRQWQRIAISRAFMRADRPEVDLLLFDEPASVTTHITGLHHSHGLTDIITGRPCPE